MCPATCGLANVKSCYLVEPGVPVMVSEGCSVFKPHTTQEQLQFNQPTETTDSEMTFAKGHWLVRVPRVKVIYCEWNGTQGSFKHGV